MYKYAFVMNSETLTPDSYRLELKGNSFYGIVLAVNSLKQACAAAGELAEQGFNKIDLCGDFSPGQAQAVLESAGGKMEVFYEIYSGAEKEKLDSLESFNPFGVIIHVGDEPAISPYSIIESDEFNTHVACVGDTAGASRAAAEMAARGVLFVELCGYFDLAKRDQIIEAIGGIIPVGYPVKA